jgi:hypothetical protein
MKFHTFWSAACLLAPLNLYAQSALPVDSISASDDKWFFQQLSAEQTGNTVAVRGRLKPGAGALQAPAGHVDIAIHDAQGKLLAETTAKYFPVDVRRARLNNGAPFEARLAVVTGVALAGSAVTVAFHRNEPLSSDTPVHGRNIAR